MSDPRPSRLSPRLGLPMAVALACLQGALLARTAWDKSDTADEPYYLATSVAQALGDFGACDAPALPKWGFAAALRVADPERFAPAPRKGRHPLWSRPMPEDRRNLLAARLATGAVTVGAGLLLWLAARRFGEPAALLALALWAFSPCVLAQGSLATLTPGSRPCWCSRCGPRCAPGRRRHPGAPPGWERCWRWPPPARSPRSARCLWRRP